VTPDEWGPPNATAPTPGSSRDPKKPREFPKQTPPHVRTSQPTVKRWVPFDSPYAKDGTLAEGGMQAPDVRFDKLGQGSIADSYGAIRGMPGAGKVPRDGDSSDS
jgi:hypothetical protein